MIATLITIRNSKRRNGKPASCEPCRRNKTKCDHTGPVCDRCRQRGIASQCFYHPAPLTKARETRAGGREQRKESSENPQPARKRRIAETAPIPQTSTSWEDRIFPTPSYSQDENLTDTVAPSTYRPGYLGPTSYAAILPRDDKATVDHGRQTSVDFENSDQELSIQHPLSKSMRMQMATEVLKALRHCSSIQSLVKGYWIGCQAGIVPERLNIIAVDAFQETVDKYDLTTREPDPILVSRVLENTTRPLHLSPSLQAEDFHRTCTGDNLRFEMLGFLLATAARAWLFGVERGKHAAHFIDEMLRSSTTCLVLCTLVSPVNDIMVWMIYENLLLTSMMCGYSGPPTWRCLGEMATQMYALGMHKESNNPNLPIFILETRRKIFGAAYNLDKTISTFLGRPLRLSKRHMDIKLPLDLSDRELCSDATTLDAAIQALDEQGWNTRGAYSRASWIRIRFTSSKFREEILDFALSKFDSSVEQQLLDVSRRIRESWDALPAHFRYGPSCWDQGIPSVICLMLVVVYLTHFYNEFMIQKLLEQHRNTPLPTNTSLLRVSMDLLSTSLTLAAIHDQTYDVHRDFLQTVMIFGIPSASVLATALQEQVKTGLPLSPGISRSEIIRTLSVLISHLENSAGGDSDTRRIGSGNWNLCKKAAQSFTRVIDAVLDPPQPRVEVGAEPDLDLDVNLDWLGAPGLDGFEGMDFMSGTFGDGIDWGAVGQWTL